MARSLTKSSFRRNNASQAEDVLRFPLEENSFFKKVVIMKKTLAAVAVLGAFAGSALAADVTLYGRVDAGLNYTNQDFKHASDSTKDYDKDSFALKSGQYTGSRFGLKGSEQVSENLTVGFQLENGFNVDDGSFGDGDRLFNREARIYAKTQFGEFAFGRMGGIDSGLGSYDMVGDASPFGTGWGGYTGSMSVFVGKTSRYDNMITYKSPTFAGLTVIAQASLKEDSTADGEEGQHTANRYYAVGVSGEYGAFSGALTYSMQDYSGLKDRMTGSASVNPGNISDFENDVSAVTKDMINDDDGQTITAWGAYDFGVTKVSLGAQYFDNVAQSRGSVTAAVSATSSIAQVAFDDIEYGFTGYGLILGAVTPVAGGNLYTAAGYADYEQAISDPTDSADKENEYEVWSLSVGYDYSLSKRTKLYTALSYTNKTENSGERGAKDSETKTTEVMAGMVHYF